MQSNKTKSKLPIYIYTLNIVWQEHLSEAIVVEPNMLVMNVQKLGISKFSFESVETGEKYYCHYHWALILNTPENFKKYQEYLIEEEKFNQLKIKIKNLRNELVTINNL